MTPRRMERREVNTTSPLQIYLHDINDTPLLSAEEEKRTGRAGGHGRSARTRAHGQGQSPVGRQYRAGISGKGTEPGRLDRGREPGTDAGGRGI